MSAAETPGSLVTAALPPVALPTARPPATLAPGTADPATPAVSPLRRRRVVLVGLDYSPAATPVAPYTTAIAEHLAALGAEVTVLAGVPARPDGRPVAPYRTGFRCADPGWLTPEAPRVIRLRHAPARPDAPDAAGGDGAATAVARGALPRRGRGAIARATRDLTFAAAVALGGRSLAADLVVAVTPSAGGAAGAAHLAARRGVPLVTLVQGTACPPGQHRPAGPAAAVTATLERRALRRSDQVAVASEAFVPAARAARVAPERLHLLPNWTRIPAAPERQRDARAALGWPVGRFTVVHAGPMGPRQDLVTVVEAARRLGGAVDVVLVGDGSCRAALEQRAFGLPGLRFVDPVDDAAPLVLAAADVLVLSGHGPGEPGQLAEYLGAGRPVLAAVPATGAAGCALRRTGGAGLRIEPGDPAALARAVSHLQASPEHRAAMGRAALRYARAHLGREASMRRLELILEAALGGSGAETGTRGC